MPNGDKPGDALGDKWRETFERNRKERETRVTRTEVRADMKSLGEEEVSAVIDQRTLEAARQKESEPPSKVTPLIIIWGITRKFTAIGAAIVAVALIVAYTVLEIVKLLNK